jgi:hypothetical protein
MTTLFLISLFGRDDDSDDELAMAMIMNKTNSRHVVSFADRRQNVRMCSQAAAAFRFHAAHGISERQTHVLCFWCSPARL